MNFDVYIKNREQPIPVSAADVDDVFAVLPNEFNPNDIVSIVPVEIEKKD